MDDGALDDGWVLAAVHDVLWVRCWRWLGDGGVMAADVGYVVDDAVGLAGSWVC